MVILYLTSSIIVNMSIWLPATTLPISPVAKVPLLFAAAVGAHITWTPPNPTPEADEASKYGYKPSYVSFSISRNSATLNKVNYRSYLILSDMTELGSIPDLTLDQCVGRNRRHSRYRIPLFRIPGYHDRSRRRLRSERTPHHVLSHRP